MLLCIIDLQTEISLFSQIILERNHQISQNQIPCVHFIANKQDSDSTNRPLLCFSC